MLVYVCYGRTPYTRNSEPLMVFYKQSSALEWCKLQESRRDRPHDYYEYEEMEVQE